MNLQGKLTIWSNAKIIYSSHAKPSIYKKSTYGLKNYLPSHTVKISVSNVTDLLKPIKSTASKKVLRKRWESSYRTFHVVIVSLTAPWLYGFQLLNSQDRRTVPGQPAVTAHGHVFPVETELSRVSRARWIVSSRVSGLRARGMYDKVITRLISIIQWAVANNRRGSARSLTAARGFVNVAIG